jgi:hypothetical protein
MHRPAGPGDVYKAILVWWIALLADAAVAGPEHVGAPGMQHDGAGHLPHLPPAHSRRVSRDTHGMLKCFEHSACDADAWGVAT